MWAAMASECAGEQGKFWDYHDKLFAEQERGGRGAFSRDSLKRYAADLKLDTAEFNACFDSNRPAQRVFAEVDAGRQKGVTGTPTIFVAGRKFDRVPTFDQVRQAVEAARPR